MHIYTTRDVNGAILTRALLKLASARRLAKLLLRGLKITYNICLIKAKPSYISTTIVPI